MVNSIYHVDFVVHPTILFFAYCDLNICIALFDRNKTNGKFTSIICFSIEKKIKNYQYFKLNLSCKQIQFKQNCKNIAKLTKDFYNFLHSLPIIESKLINFNPWLDMS